MEKAQAGTARNSESSTLVKKTDVDELSKEKEEELLFGAEDEDGDDEDTMSDDSLRLRLSDDDAEEEQEQAVTNDTNIAKLKPQSKRTEQPVLDTAVEEKLPSGLRKTVKEVSKSEESAQKESNTTIKVPENSTFPLDECTSENKQDKTRNSEKSSATNKSNEKRTIKSSTDLKSTDVSKACSSVESNNRSEKDNLSINNRTHTSTVQNATDKKLTIHEEKNLKKIASESGKIISTTCEPNKLHNVDSNSPSIDCANIKSKQLSTTASVSNNDNLGKKMIEKHIENNSLKHLHVELITCSPDNADLNLQSDNSSYKDIIIVHKSKNKNPESVNVTESESASNKSKFTENRTKQENISLIQNQDNSSNVKDNTEVTNKDRDANKSVIQTIDINNLKSQNILIIPSDVDNNDKGTKSTDTIVPRKKRIRKTINTVQEHAEEDKQEEKESGRQRRKTARNAEEIIRKNLNNDSDSSDSSDNFVIVNHKVNVDAHPSSPPSLKRNCPENEVFNGNTKKARMNIKNSEEKNVAQLSFIEKFFRRDLKEKLPRLTQEELEELLIQKIVETIAMRSEIGQLREQARISERYQETTRVKMQQLLKQVKDFEMVLNRNAVDRRANPDKPVAPIKINRSVGLQVSFITEHGIQNLRQATVKSTANITTTANSTASSTTTTETNSNATGSRRTGIKIRSPRSAVPVTAPVITQNHSLPTASVISTVTPAALVVAKPLEPSSHTLTLSKQATNIQPILPAVSQQPIQSQPHQTIVLNGKVQNQVNRPQLIAPKPRNNDLIDLTDEEEKNKSANAKVTSTTTTPVIEQQLNITPKSTQSFQRVIQAIPANVVPTIAQPASIKVLTTNQQSTPTLVNNVNQPRVAYVMQSATGSPRQVLIASNSNQQVQIRPMSGPRASQQFSTVTYKTGVSAIANGAVRVLATPVLSNIQISKHPAPLPDIPNYAATPGWKLPPPAPSLKISKVSNGIVLSWNMNLTDKYADIASYQLYAYQEVAGVNPSTSLWKKVGDVRALPLPMACTLTQFSEGNNYYFAVRAVDTHSRKGQYSIPGNISL